MDNSAIWLTRSSYGARTRAIVAVVFNLAVVVGLYFLGMSTTTAWLTFLAFCGFAGGAEIGMQLILIEEKLHEINRVEEKLHSPKASERGQASAK